MNIQKQQVDIMDDSYDAMGKDLSQDYGVVNTDIDTSRKRRGSAGVILPANL